MGMCHQPVFGAHLLSVPELAALCQMPMSHPRLVPTQGIFTSFASGSHVASPASASLFFPSLINGNHSGM